MPPPENASTSTKWETEKLAIPTDKQHIKKSPTQSGRSEGVHPTTYYNLHFSSLHLCMYRYNIGVI